MRNIFILSGASEPTVWSISSYGDVDDVWHRVKSKININWILKSFLDLLRFSLVFLLDSIIVTRVNDVDCLEIFSFLFQFSIFIDIVRYYYCPLFDFFYNSTYSKWIDNILSILMTIDVCVRLDVAWRSTEKGNWSKWGTEYWKLKHFCFDQIGWYTFTPRSRIILIWLFFLSSSRHILKSKSTT